MVSFLRFGRSICPHLLVDAQDLRRIDPEGARDRQADGDGRHQGEAPRHPRDRVHAAGAGELGLEQRRYAVSQLRPDLSFVLEHGHGVDARGAARREPGGGRRDDSQDGGRLHDRGGVGGSQTVDEACQKAAGKQDGADPGRGAPPARRRAAGPATGGRRSSRTWAQPSNMCPGSLAGAEGHVHTQITMRSISCPRSTGTP